MTVRTHARITTGPGTTCSSDCARCSPRFSACWRLARRRKPALHARSQAAEGRRFDVVVYGGTAGGVMTAVAAAREGLTVALLEPGRHLGGMVSGGLGWTDYGKKEVIGGYSLEFFERVGRKYGRDIEWHFEPHVAEAIFGELVKEAGVTVFTRPPAAREDRRRASRARRVYAHRHRERRQLRADGLRRRQLRGRPDGAGRRHLHLGPRGHRPVRRVAGRRARADAAAPVPRPGVPVRRARSTAAGDHAAHARMPSAPPTSGCRPTTSACA